MNLYRFVNSKDIRNHLQKIGYEFSSVEAAWLIDQCRDASIEEKHSAWSELIETMPDCRIEKRRNAIPHERLHEYLRESMRLSRLYAMNAPEVIINNEARLLAQAMVINRYAVRFEKKEIEIPFV